MDLSGVLRNRKFLIILSLVLVIVGVWNISSFSNVKNDCYTREKVCMGLGSECSINIFDSISVDKKDSCESYEDIVDRCQTLKTQYCTGNLPGNWSDSAHVNGLKCSQWQSKYRFEVPKCS